jgi:hypothetical protein
MTTSFRVAADGTFHVAARPRISTDENVSTPHTTRIARGNDEFLTRRSPGILGVSKVAP